MIEIPECFYRVSVKALILNDTRDKFLICEKESGVWELPGGGLDWGTTPQEDLPREISEEMRLQTTWVADNPSYFIIDQTIHRKQWVVNVVYETEIENLDFTSSDECVNIKFVNKEAVESMNVFPATKQLIEMFDPRNHAKKF